MKNSEGFCGRAEDVLIRLPLLVTLPDTVMEDCLVEPTCGRGEGGVYLEEEMRTDISNGSAQRGNIGNSH